MDDSLRLTTDPKYSSQLTAIKSRDDIPKRWHDSPLESLISAHNFDIPIQPASSPQLMVVTCIEFRFQPKVPHSFAYEVRRASGRLIGSEFTLAYALAKGVRHMALIGHNDCGMTKVPQHVEALINALVEQGWPRDRAEDYVTQQGPRYAIRDELDSLKREYFRLRRLFKKLEIAPLFAALANNNLWVPNWYIKNPDATHDEDEQVSPVDLLLL